MTAATQNSVDKVYGIKGLTAYDLTFAATSDTFTVTYPVRRFWFSVYGTGAAQTNRNTNITQASGVFTLTDSSNTAIAVYLYVIENK